MTPEPQESTNPISQNKNTVPFQWKQLVREIQEIFFIEDESASEIFQNFRGLYKGKYRLSANEVPKKERLKTSQFTLRRYRIMHKLLRIHNELKFAKEHHALFKELTQREIEILQLVTQGKSNPQIAKALFISRATVEQHRKHINCKLKIESWAHLIRYGYAFDLI